MSGLPDGEIIWHTETIEITFVEEDNMYKAYWAHPDGGAIDYEATCGAGETPLEAIAVLCACQAINDWEYKDGDPPKWTNIANE